MSSNLSDLGVPADLVQRLTRRGITEPFAIQAATLPDALAGRDVCGRAPTGSGKTMAFGIPMVLRINKGKSRPRHPRGLVLVPTRELAAQVQRELVLLAGPGGARVTTFYGGVGFGGQLAALRGGTDIAVACPGRLADLVKRRELVLSEVEIVVIDEADRMADMGFLPEVKRILDQVQPDRQTLLFSATLDGDVDVLIRRYQHDPVRHEVAVDVDAPQSRQVFWRAQRPERVKLTAQVVGAAWPAIVFCRTKRGADRVATQLGASGISAAAIHGDLSQNQRERALAAFAGGRVQALVATDIAARGIHVDHVAAVVHFDVPADEKDYVHRSGRTGRAGEAGLVVTMVGDDEVGSVRKMQSKLRLPSVIQAPSVASLEADATDPRPLPPVPVPSRPDRPSADRSSAGAGRGGAQTARPASRRFGSESRAGQGGRGVQAGQGGRGNSAWRAQSGEGPTGGQPARGGVRRRPTSTPGAPGGAATFGGRPQGGPRGRSHGGAGRSRDSRG